MRAAALILALALSAGAQTSALGLAKTTFTRLWHGTEALPGAAVRHWRVTVPLVVGTGALIAWGDAPAARRVQSLSLERRSRTWSNWGLLAIEPGVVLGTTVAELRCVFCRPVGDMVVVAGSTEVYATAASAAIKHGLGRERPFTPADSDGGFNESGTSFPSGHALGTFTMASVLAHRFPSATWANRAAYAVAGGTALARFTGKEHFPSDLVAGAVMGVLAGSCAITCR